MRHFVSEQNEQKFEYKYTATHYMASKAIICTAWDADHKEKAGSRRCIWHHSLHLRDLWSGYWCPRQLLYVSKKEANVLQAAFSSKKHRSCQLVRSNGAESQCPQPGSTACCSGFLLTCRTGYPARGGARAEAKVPRSRMTLRIITRLV